MQLSTTPSNTVLAFQHAPDHDAADSHRAYRVLLLPVLGLRGRDERQRQGGGTEGDVPAGQTNGLRGGGEGEQSDRETEGGSGGTKSEGGVQGRGRVFQRDGQGREDSGREPMRRG